ncbi:MAG: 30S ribosome-binding factor RbfA, partial [Deltaproteobacteria bacterium]|nr:30S ribosome-binding factor RbfA [Deltaproteobacteria bacterium]
VDEIRDPRVGFITVTEVRVTHDLRSARVYVSIYGNAEQRQASLAGLTAAAGYLKRELGHRLRLRYTPELTFAHDDSLDRAQRIDTLMNAIAHGEVETPAEAAPAPVPVQTARSELVEAARTFEPPPEPRRRQRKMRRR